MRTKNPLATSALLPCFRFPAAATVRPSQTVQAGHVNQSMRECHEKTVGSFTGRNCGLLNIFNSLPVGFGSLRAPQHHPRRNAERAADAGELLERRGQSVVLDQAPVTSVHPSRGRRLLLAHPRRFARLTDRGSDHPRNATAAIALSLSKMFNNVGKRERPPRGSRAGDGRSYEGVDFGGGGGRSGMALATCPECGGQVSDLAPACPHCGCPFAVPSVPSSSAAKRRSRPKGNALTTDFISWPRFLFWGFVLISVLTLMLKLGTLQIRGWNVPSNRSASPPAVAPGPDPVTVDKAKIKADGKRAGEMFDSTVTPTTR